MHAPAKHLTLIPTALLLVVGCVGDFIAGPCEGGIYCWNPGDIPLGSIIEVLPDTVLAVGESVQLTATLKNAGTNGGSDGPFTWKSHDTEMLTVEGGFAVARLPGRTTVSLRHTPTGTERSFNQVVRLGNAARDTAEFVQMDAACGIDSSGSAYCWGGNLWGALGIGFADGGARATPASVAGNHRFASIHTSSIWQACGLRSDGRALCWGNNELGRLGIGQTATGLQPTEVVGGLEFGSIHLGHGEICGITTDHRAWCWGMTASGMRPAPTRVEGEIQWADIAAGDGWYTCGTDLVGRAYCWGTNGAGQLGDGTRIDRARPTPVAGGRTYTDIAQDLGRTCAIEEGGRLFCWGPAIGTNEARLVPEPLGPDRRYRQLTAGGWQMCALDDQGMAWCWGYPGEDRLVAEPRAVPGNVRFTSVAADLASACGVATDGRAWCWGSNHWGGLGTGSFDDSAVPVPVVRIR